VAHRNTFSTAEFRSLGTRRLADVHPSDITLYEHLPTGDCYQVQQTIDQYRKSHDGTTKQDVNGPWLNLQR
jgi:hypothetical protein